MASEVSRDRSRSERDMPLGTARWMEAAEARGRFTYRDVRFRRNDRGLWEGVSDGQFWMGEAIDAEAGGLGYEDDRHICLVSGTRGGKGTGFLIPNLALWPGSCVVIDPKGENATVTARRRGAGSAYCHGIGQQVCILDPFGEVQLDPALKARFNPLDTIDPAGDFAVDDAGRVAAALMIVESRTDPFWEEAARDLIKGLILFVLTDEAFDGARNLVSVWRLVNQGDWISAAALREAGETNIPSGSDLLWSGMKRSTAFNGLIAGVGEYFASMAERTRSSILGSAKAALEFISGAPMQRVLEASDFDLAAIKTDPKGLSLFLTLPQRYMSTHYRWLRLMTSLAIGEMERIKGRPATGYPTLFLLDEFAGLKRMEVIEHAAAQAAGFGAKFLFVVQNLTQLKETYKDSWETFLGNSGLKLFFHIEDDFTRSYLSRQLGEYEVRRTSQSGSDTQSASFSTTIGQSSSLTDGASRTTTTGQNANSSRTQSHGTSRGGSSSFGSTFQSFTSAYQRGENWGDSQTQGSGWSQSEAAGTSQSFSKSHSSSQSRSNSASRTQGWSEAVHKRFLMNPDEIGRLLARVGDRADPAYPGIALALIPGRNPLLTRRVNYFETPRFLGFFDPHPDFPAPPSLAERASRLLVEPKPTWRQRVLMIVSRKRREEYSFQKAQEAEAAGNFDAALDLYAGSAMDEATMRGLARTYFMAGMHAQSEHEAVVNFGSSVKFWDHVGARYTAEEQSQRAEVHYRLAQALENGSEGRFGYAKALGLYAVAAESEYKDSPFKFAALLVSRQAVWQVEKPADCVIQPLAKFQPGPRFMEMIRAKLAACSLRRARAAYDRLCRARSKGDELAEAQAELDLTKAIGRARALERFENAETQYIEGILRETTQPEWALRAFENAFWRSHVEGAYRGSLLLEKLATENPNAFAAPLSRLIKLHALAAEGGHRDAREKLAALLD